MMRLPWPARLILVLVAASFVGAALAWLHILIGA